MFTSYSIPKIGNLRNFTTFLIVFSLSITYVWCYKATIKKYIIPRLYIQKN